MVEAILTYGKRLRSTQCRQFLFKTMLAALELLKNYLTLAMSDIPEASSRKCLWTFPFPGARSSRSITATYMGVFRGGGDLDLGGGE